MKFSDILVSRELRFSIGVEESSGRYYISIPVSSQLADYEKYYELTEEQFEEFRSNFKKASTFADQCRSDAMPEMSEE